MSILGYSSQKICIFYTYQSMGYSFIRSVLGSVIAYIICSFFGLNLLSTLGNYGVPSKDLLLPVSYLFFVIVSIIGVGVLLGYVVAVIKTRNRKR